MPSQDGRRTKTKEGTRAKKPTKCMERARKKQRDEWTRNGAKNYTVLEGREPHNEAMHVRIAVDEGMERRAMDEKRVDEAPGRRENGLE